MANITLTSPQFYKNGVSGVSAVVGYESQSNRVVRYSLRTDSLGASHVDLAFSGVSKGGGAVPRLRFYIGTDPDSHADAGSAAVHTAPLTATDSQYTGGADILLLPETDYYVWVFPATQSFGWMHWSTGAGTAVANCSGGALTRLTAEPGELGSPMTLQLTPYGDFTHTVTCTLGSATLTVAENTAETLLTWTPPLELACQLPNAISGQAIFTVTAFRQGIALGSVQTGVQLTVPESVVPTVTAGWRDESGAHAQLNTCVQLVSRLRVDADGYGAWGSTILSTAVTLNGQPYTGGVLTTAGEQALTVTVTDSRGRTGSVTHILPVMEYAAPWVQVDASRCDADGNPDDMGEYALLTLRGAFGDMAGQNEATLSYGYGNQLQVEPVASGQVAVQRVIPADSTQTLTIWAVLRDRLMASPKATTVLSIGYATLDFLSGGKGIAFGTTATKQGFTCAMDTDFCGHAVTGLPAPAQPQDAATKAYVDEAVQSATPIPMLVGQEYLTNECWNGRPVYTKMLAFSPKKITAQTVTLPHGIQGLDIGLSVAVLWRYVNASGNVTWRNFPAVYYGTVEWSAQAYFEGADNIKFELGSQVRTNMAASAQDFYVTLRYVKEAL